MLSRRSRWAATSLLVGRLVLVPVLLEQEGVFCPVLLTLLQCSRIQNLKVCCYLADNQRSNSVVGLFAGVSLEGTALIERKDANRDFYGSMVPAKDILTGRVPPPEVASRMYEIIEVRQKMHHSISR